MRGIEFKETNPAFGLLPQAEVNSVITEVANWLGFHDNEDYLRTLIIEKELIFKRATY